MAKNRARDARRVAKSIRTHQATMAAYGAAAISQPSNSVGDPAHFLKPESVRLVGSSGSKIDKQRRKGLITDKEANSERFEAGLKSYLYEGKETFHKGLLKPAAQYQKEKDK